MSFASRLIHALVIVTPTDSGDEDEHGQPVAGDPIETAVAGLIQPRSAREVAQTSQAGPEIATHVAYLLPQELSGAAWIRFEPDDGRRYEITGIRRYEFGGSPHLEVDCRLVTSDELVLAGS